MSITPSQQVGQQPGQDSLTVLKGALNTLKTVVPQISEQIGKQIGTGTDVRAAISDFTERLKPLISPQAEEALKTQRILKLIEGSFGEIGEIVSNKATEASQRLHHPRETTENLRKRWNALNTWLQDLESAAQREWAAVRAPVEAFEKQIAAREKKEAEQSAENARWRWNCFKKVGKAAVAALIPVGLGALVYHRDQLPSCPNPMSIPVSTPTSIPTPSPESLKQFVFDKIASFISTTPAPQPLPIQQSPQLSEYEQYYCRALSSLTESGKAAGNYLYSQLPSSTDLKGYADTAVSAVTSCAAKIWEKAGDVKIYGYDSRVVVCGGVAALTLSALFLKCCCKRRKPAPRLSVPVGPAASAVPAASRTPAASTAAPPAAPVDPVIPAPVDPAASAAPVAAPVGPVVPAASAAPTDPSNSHTPGLPAAGV